MSATAGWWIAGIVCAAIFAAYGLFTRHVLRQMSESVRRIDGRLSRRRYVTFTSTGIHVDIERYLRTDAGKAALDRIDRSRP